MDLGRLNFFLQFLSQRLSAPDYAEAESLLHAAVDPAHARRRHEEAAKVVRSAQETIADDE